jgi:hypothetical protein
MMMLASLAFEHFLYFPNIFHPLTGMGYQFWSGIAGSFLMSTGIFVFVTKHNCHQHRCLRLSWHPDAEGHPVCKKHHEDHPSKGWFRSDKTHPRHSKNK